MENQIFQIYKPSIYQKLNIINGIKSAPCYIYVFSIPGENPEITEENYGAVCCAIQNMQLTATSMNLGVGWSTGKMAKINNLHSILDMDSSYKVVGVLTVGHPDTNLEKSREDFNNITKWLYSNLLENKCDYID